jgi:arginine/lysine/ornithine decarboxylase
MLSGLVLTGARPVYLRPEWDEALGLDHCVTAETVERALDEHPDARAVCALHPTYHGAVSDLRRIAALCHARGKPLLVDEAHGPHFHFHPALPVSALEAGADLVVQSSHKLASAMTQASLLHARHRVGPSGQPLVDPSRLRQALQLVQSTSPSYVLMASLDAARRQLALEGERLLDGALRLAEDARRRLNALTGVSVFGRERVGHPGLFDLDVTRLTIDVTGLGVTGFELLPLLGSEYGVQPEMATLHHVLLLVTPGNSAADLDRVVAAFESLSERGTPSAIPRLAAVPEPLPSPCALPELAMTPRDAFFARAEAVRFEASVGRVSAELVAPYPPGIPVLAPGEVVSAEAAGYLRRVQRMGATLHGPEDAQLRTLKVVRR